MGETIRIRKGNEEIVIQPETKGKELKQLLALPPDSVLVNARNEIIGNEEPVTKKVKDGEAIAAYPTFKQW